QRKRDLRLKRGGGMEVASLDATDDDDTASLQVADTASPLPDAVFDRQWALAVIDRAMTILEREFASDGKANEFSALKQWLMGEDPSHSQRDAARELGLSEGAVKVAIHRLRKRFRDAVRAEISQTLRDPTLLDEELRHLISALS